MVNEVWNEVPIGTPKMEQVNGRWVVRYNYTESPNEGMVRCKECLINSRKKPQMEIVKEIVEGAGDVFIPSEYGY